MVKRHPVTQNEKRPVVFRTENKRETLMFQPLVSCLFKNQAAPLTHRSRGRGPEKGRTGPRSPKVTAGAWSPCWPGHFFPPALPNSPHSSQNRLKVEWWCWGCAGGWQTAPQVTVVLRVFILRAPPQRPRITPSCSSAPQALRSAWETVFSLVSLQIGF